MRTPHAHMSRLPPTENEIQALAANLAALG